MMDVDENLSVRHDKAGIVSMANKGYKDSNNSQVSDFDRYRFGD